MDIREYRKETDLVGLQLCVIALQNYERTLDPRMPSGESIVGAYIDDLLERCEKHTGRILIAVEGGEVAGYVTVLSEVQSEDLDDGDLEYALVADLMVLEKFQRLGIGRKLLEAAERFARERGARFLRIGALAANTRARALYASMDFSEHLLNYEKALDGTGGLPGG